jgi:shikimate kinase
MPERLVLVGFMGSGKSTVGRLVARSLGWGFLDMDHAIERSTGLTLAELFRERGEAFFREEERRLALETQSLTEHVIAAGGGAFASPDTREALRAGSVTVWLHCDLPTLLARLPPDGSRPLAVSRERIQDLFVEREPSYRMADRTVDAVAAPEEVASRVMRAVFTDGPRTRGREDR